MPVGRGKNGLALHNNVADDISRNQRRNYVPKSKEKPGSQCRILHARQKTTHPDLK